jgi:hypothetical protein
MRFELEEQIKMLNNLALDEPEQNSSRVLKAFPSVLCELQRAFSATKLGGTSNSMALATIEGAGLLGWSATNKTVKQVPMKLKKKLFNRVKRETGFVVKVRVSKTYIQYRENGRVAIITVEPGKAKHSIRISHQPPWVWNSPISGEVIPPDKCSEVPNNIACSLKMSEGTRRVYC